MPDILNASPLMVIFFRTEFVQASAMRSASHTLSALPGYF